MASKYYAVRVGKTPGIYFSWDECKKMVDGYPSAEYKSFKTLEEAEAFVNAKASAKLEDTTQELPSVYSFVDGSFNPVEGRYGYGGFLVVNGERYILQGSGTEEEMAQMRNVSGEVLGAMAAVEKAISLGVSELAIYYDYMGIEKWAIGEWKRNKKGTIAYYDYMQSVKDKITVTFVKVAAHTGVDGNEEADRLAKEAVGI